MSLGLGGHAAQNKALTWEENARGTIVIIIMNGIMNWLYNVDT